ncbi:23S rRNA (cytidine(2498)-2'-O)-methyltransferase RlmM [Tahibacter amnicola]|uniref:Ribosomal RNA large subunit methyltransferase M n=1 Tax=Tahibacter amnicola TaxID=2976241 RepID=A0ABY6BC84_9GAMM|nr:23S rRNA (cytidine(2498)-2'-O)-methyltransferase RlmM [Tahibacter amnicola]UXI67658.1 23S rRNA (cytidine(2498)-2'-O)-methyltransferase RlmM [Tahibacter amnicola]
MSHPLASGVLVYCRSGFEGEAAQELDTVAAHAGVAGFARTERGAGFAEFVLVEPMPAEALLQAIGWPRLVFARQAVAVLDQLKGLPREDRLTPLLAELPTDFAVADAWVESPDTDDGKALTAFCRSFGNALVQALKRDARLVRDSPWRLHALFPHGDRCFLAVAHTALCAPWPLGIPRLKFPRNAPSRSTLKLDEAIQVLLTPGERERWFKSGMTAVDLGAAPGGWTWQLVRRALHVTAVDNGPMQEELMAGGHVTHLREDGFRYQPKRRVDWMVCDMVEQPRRVAERMGEWLAEGWCQRSIFNLKLPMKKRYTEVQQAFERIHALVHRRGGQVELRAKQLYHDREEITVFARVLAEK